MLPIVTQRVLLRDFTPDEFDAFYATSQDPAYQQYYPDHEQTRAHWLAVFERICAGAAAVPRAAFQLAVCLPAGDLIGTCGVRIEDAEHGQASFGCAIARPYWGLGYAFAASHALIDFGFSALSVHRLYAETNSQNSRARTLAERLGMRLEGELRQHKFFQDRWWDTAIYAILAHEWAQTRPISHTADDKGKR